MLIIWSNTANSDNLQNIGYLFENWNLKVVLNYEQKVIEIENLLLSNPKLGSFDENLGLYKILIIPQIYLFYNLNGDEIQIIRIWNNYKKPYW